MDKGKTLQTSGQVWSCGRGRKAVLGRKCIILKHVSKEVSGLADSSHWCTFPLEESIICKKWLGSSTPRCAQSWAGAAQGKQDLGWKPRRAIGVHWEVLSQLYSPQQVLLEGDLNWATPWLPQLIKYGLWRQVRMYSFI